jgi:hypothetical protein
MSITNSERLVSLGQALYGPRWKRPLGRALGYDARTIRGWAKGTPKEPEDRIIAAVMKIAREKQQGIQQAIEHVRTPWVV